MRTCAARASMKERKTPEKAISILIPELSGTATMPANIAGVLVTSPPAGAHVRRAVIIALPTPTAAARSPRTRVVIEIPPRPKPRTSIRGDARARRCMPARCTPAVLPAVSGAIRWRNRAACGSHPEPGVKHTRAALETQATRPPEWPPSSSPRELEPMQVPAGKPDRREAEDDRWLGDHPAHRTRRERPAAHAVRPERLRGLAARCRKPPSPAERGGLPPRASREIPA